MLSHYFYQSAHLEANGLLDWEKAVIVLSSILKEL
jgi:hypothetical protein